MASSLAARDQQVFGVAKERFLTLTNGSIGGRRGSAAARDHGSFCISCHTAVPYALSRAAYRRASGEKDLSPNERVLIDNVTRRVRLWKEVAPFYSGDGELAGKAAESRGTEAILSALILANRDAQNGRLSDDTRAAFDNMWALQQTTGDAKGAWQWLQFNNEPFEAKDSQYYGAALAAVAVGMAPDNYWEAPGIQPNLKRLRDYLRREEPAQSTINRVVLLWASVKWHGLLDQRQQESIIKEVVSHQQPDGGWSLASLAWTWSNWSWSSLLKMWLRSDVSSLHPQADGYATGLITYVLEQAALPCDSNSLQRALVWLAHNQDERRGGWAGYSLNYRSDPSLDVGKFMVDAATAYAVMALPRRQKNRPLMAKDGKVIFESAAKWRRTTLNK